MAKLTATNCPALARIKACIRPGYYAMCVHKANKQGVEAAAHHAAVSHGYLVSAQSQQNNLRYFMTGEGHHIGFSEENGFCSRTEEIGVVTAACPPGYDPFMDETTNERSR